MDHNLLVRPDLSGTDGDESPTCLLASFGAEYWNAMGGRNLTFVNNTCLTFSGDVYSYQLDQAAKKVGGQLADRRGRRGVEPAVPPPFYHPKCVPEKMDNMYWFSAGNALLTANASGASINCNTKQQISVGRNLSMEVPQFYNCKRVQPLSLCLLSKPKGARLHSWRPLLRRGVLRGGRRGEG